MFSDSSALWAGLRQQRMLSPAQTNKLNVTLIRRLIRILKAFVERVGILFFKKRKKNNP